MVVPLDAVTESASVVLEITDTSARVNFVGTVPLACYLTYGTDETFGNVTNDPDMAQAAIIEHNPILLDLQPDTEYVYRMQGIGEDGVIYVSNVYSFRTLPADKTLSANLLSPERGAVVTGVSSNFGSQDNDGRWGILNAFDGNAATAWATNGDGDNGWFEVELAETSQIDELEFFTRQMSDGTSIITSFTVTIDDGSVYGPFEVDIVDQSTTFEVDFISRTLRFDINSSTGGNTGALEVAAYGSPVSD
jgi:hypothetical protein